VDEDLDFVVEKLRENASQRYASAAELSDEIGRCLDRQPEQRAGRPILAVLLAAALVPGSVGQAAHEDAAPFARGPRISESFLPQKAAMP
jgi:hypothetical protein